MERKVILDPSKVEYDGTSFKVVMTEEEVLFRFKMLQEQLEEDFNIPGNLGPQ